MSNWLHRLFNPHCSFCASEKECINCDMLRQLLADERENNKRLLSAVLQDNQSTPVATNDEEIKPVNISKQAVPWRIRREMLEAEDAQKAKLERQNKEENKTIEELEKELGLVTNEKETPYEGNHAVI